MTSYDDLKKLHGEPSVRLPREDVLLMIDSSYVESVYRQALWKGFTGLLLILSMSAFIFFPNSGPKVLTGIAVATLFSLCLASTDRLVDGIMWFVISLWLLVMATGAIYGIGHFDFFTLAAMQAPPM